MAARAVFGKQHAAAAHRIRAEFTVEIGDQVLPRVGRSAAVLGLALAIAGDVEIGLVALGGNEEVEDVRQAILDRPEVRAVAPALADAKRRLAEAALHGVDLAEVRQVVDPARLGARADVEIDPLDRFEGADRILPALQDVMDAVAAERLVVASRAAHPALVVAARLAPALVLVLLAAARVGLAPFGDDLAGEQRALREVDDRVHRPRVVDLVVRDRRRVGNARARVREHLPFDAGLRHPRAQELRHARVLVADEALDVLPLRMRGILRRIERVERDVARAAGRADQERRLDRGIGELAHALVRGNARRLDHLPAEAVPVRDVARVHLFPLLRVEARIRKLAEAQPAGGRAELEIAGGMALVERSALVCGSLGSSAASFNPHAGST